VAAFIVNGMGTRNRRIRDKRRAAARQRNTQRVDTTTLASQPMRPVRFVYTLSCPSCGYSHADEMIAPSAAPAGAQVDIATSCTCGGRTYGTARVNQVPES
jgi:hypothetical protein